MRDSGSDFLGAEMDDVAKEAEGLIALFEKDAEHDCQ